MTHSENSLRITIPALLIFFLSLGLYTWTLYPGVGGGLDSAELQISGKILGISHPSGYPLYHLLSYLISWIPVSTLAWRMTFVSALCAAGFSAILFALVWSLCSNRVIAAVAAFLCLTSFPVWQNATVTEVYALQFCVHVLILLSYIRWLQSQKPIWILICSLGLGIGLAHHLMTAVVLVGIVFTGYGFPNRHRFDVKTSFQVVLFFCLPLLSFLYFPIRAAMQAHSFDSYEFHAMADYVFYILGGANSHLLHTEPEWVLQNGVMEGIHALMRYWGVLPVLLAAVGVCESVKAKRIETIPLLWVAVVHILFAGIWTEADREAILVPAMVSGSVFMAVGLQSFFSIFKGWSLAAWSVQGVAGVLLGLLLYVNTVQSYQTLTQRNAAAENQYYPNVYEALPQQAVVLTSYWEETNIMKYLAWSGEYDDKQIQVFRYNDSRSRAGVDRVISYLQGKTTIGNPPLPPQPVRLLFFLQPPAEEDSRKALTLKPVPIAEDGFIYQALLTAEVYQQEKGYIPLEQLSWELLEWNWVEPRPGRSVNGNPLMIGETLYPEGYGVHAGTKMRIPVPSQSKWFSCTVGVSGDLPPDAPSSIMVLLSTNQQLLKRSPVLTTQSGGWDVHYPLQNESELVLEIWGTEDGLKADHAVLAEPRFYFQDHESNQ